ncbi:MAG: hypothetical protein ChlgKO_08220 [Chlamydiales bacterium]
MSKLIDGIANKNIKIIESVYHTNPKFFTSDRYVKKISLFSLRNYSNSTFSFICHTHPDREALIKLAVREGSDEAVRLMLRDFPELEKFFFEWIEAEEDLLIRQLVRMKITPKNDDEETFLHVAADLGNLDLVTFLLENSFDPSSTDLDGFTPIVSAIGSGHLGVVKILHQDSDKNARFGENAYSLLQIAIRWKKIDIVQFLLLKRHDPNALNGKGQNSLQVAVQRDHLEIVKLLMFEKNMKPNVFSHSKSPLMLAALANQVEIMDELIQAGAKPEMARHSETHVAASRGNLRMLNLLNKYGFIQLHRNQHGKTPVDLLVQNREVKREVAEFFDQIGASFVSLDSNGSTPLHVATALCNYNVLEYFFDREVKASPIMDALIESEIKTKTFQGQRLSRVRDIKGNTLFHIAAEKGYCLLLERLFSLNPHFVQTRNNDGKVPIEVATDEEVMSFLIKLEHELVFGKNTLNENEKIEDLSKKFHKK